MSAWQEVYSDTQRAAIVHAGGVVKIRPWKRITALAAAGELPDPDRPGETVDAFEIPESSARSIARIHERRSRGLEVRPELAAMPARDRAHALQLRLSGLVDHELARLERVSRNGRALDVKRCQDLARALREMATLPDPKDLRLPRTPGDRVPGSGERPEGATRHGLAGALLRAADRGGDPARDDVQRENTHEDNDVYTPAENANESQDHEHEHDGQDDDGPCSTPCADGTAFSAELVTGAPAA